MKKTNLFFIFFLLLCLNLLVNIEVEAQYTVNKNGSITITERDIMDKIEISGSAEQPKLTRFGASYKLTDAQNGINVAPAQVGSIYLRDRLSTNEEFAFVGYVDSYQRFITDVSQLDWLGDGQSLVFHADDNKKYGNTGHGLGILGLKNAQGLVFDVFNNQVMPSTDWQPGQPTSDPVTDNEIYFQGWSTDAYGKGKRVTQAVEYDKLAYGLRGQKKVTMLYYPKGPMTGGKELIYGVQVPGETKQNTHVMPIPDYIDYFYFSSTASTGWSTSSFTTHIESITYMPFRKKTVRYYDADANVEYPTLRHTQEVKLNQPYSMVPKNKLPGYDIVAVDGKLSGVVDFKEDLNDEFVNIYMRAPSRSYTYKVNVADSTLNREVVNNKELLSINGKKLDIEKKKSVAKITITTPTNIERDINKSMILYSGWQLSEYKTKNKNVYQLYNSNYDNPINEKENLKTINEIQAMIDVFGKFQLTDIESQLDNQNIEIELSNYPMPFYENYEETQKVAYSFPKLFDAGFRERSVYEGSNFSPSIEDNTKVMKYRTLNAQRTTYNDDNSQFLKDTLGNKAVATTDKNIIKGTNYSNATISSHLVKYNLKLLDSTASSVKGQEEMASVSTAKLPEPIDLIIKTSGNITLETKKMTTKYAIGDIIYKSEAELPQIEGFHFSGFEDGNNNFPIKVTDKKQEIVVLYEPDGPVWGTVPWEFNKTTGELTFTGGGTLGEYQYSPWNISGNQKIAASSIKIITFTEKVKTPENSNLLFSTEIYDNNEMNLSHVTKINGLDKLDTSDTIRMSNMFRRMSSLEELELSSFNTSNVTNTGSMFRDMLDLKKLDLSQLDMSQAENMNNMFNGLASMEELDISNFNTKEAKNQQGMLGNIPKLKVLKLGKMTQLSNTLLVTPSGESYTGNWQSVGKGTVDKPLGEFVGTVVDLEKLTQQSPVDETYVWELKSDVNVTVNYYQLSSTNSVTENQIVDNLETGDRKKTLHKNVKNNNQSIEEALKENDLLQTSDVEGYEFVERQTVVVIDDSTGDKLTLQDKVPNKNFTVNYYFKPIIEFNVPDSINFGSRTTKNSWATYGMVPDKDETNNRISVINTYENEQGKPDWTLYASTEGFYSLKSGGKLLANVLFKLPGESEPIVILDESTPLFTHESAFKKDINLTNKSKEKEGLFIQVSKVYEAGDYSGELKYTMQTAP